jgi:hypothetical protein
METYRKAKDQIIIPPRKQYHENEDVPDELASMEGEVYGRHDLSVLSFNEKV